MSFEVVRLEDIVGDDRKKGSIEVPVNIEVDLGNLLAIDERPLPSDQNSKLIESLTRDCVQAIVNKLWQCETQVDYDTVTALLPPPTEPIPREKPVPKPRPPTKWESFAKEKGIKKQKKSTKVWDEASKSWKFTWGYRKQIGEKQQKDYAANLQREMDENEGVAKKGKRNQTPNKKHLTKGERVAKNELSRLRNIARTKKKANDTGGILPTPSMHGRYIPLKSESRKALDVATASTASLGRFTEALKDDKRQKVVRVREKASAQGVTNADASAAKREKQDMLKLFEKIQNRKETVDSATAAKAALAKQQRSKDEDEGFSKKRISKTQKKKREGAKAHSSRIPLAQLKKKQKQSGGTGISSSKHKGKVMKRKGVGKQK